MSHVGALSVSVYDVALGKGPSSGLDLPENPQHTRASSVKRNAELEAGSETREQERF